ncbi:Na+/H+ antiporter subunit G [Sphingomonas baiyangensis]|uniref:Na+/H+ antiporter subunit G n=1 Tax=Sphingomonas baiyangensis TaxID=2572576 RepID=A0A4U1L251_9SPHN|nr:Na+/H+ antiporter subunit G [Sphingomonas baiyangensis]TKD50243.1 Na+/H+ antiporter subunit G [Sphingomonas baiyangensis]
MSAQHLVEAICALLLVIGASFALIGSWGLVRLPTLMERLHGPTKATTLGLGGMLLGSMLFFQLSRGTWSAHELLISLFLFLTAPVAANLIAKVHLHRLRASENPEAVSAAGMPPPVPGDADWATYEAPHPGTPAATSEADPSPADRPKR